MTAQFPDQKGFEDRLVHKKTPCQETGRVEKFLRGPRRGLQACNQAPVRLFLMMELTVSEGWAPQEIHLSTFSRSIL